MPRKAHLAEAAAVVFVAILGAWLLIGRSARAIDTYLLGSLQPDKYGALYLHEQVHRSLAAAELPFVDRHELWPIGAPMATMNGANVLEMLVSGAFRVFTAFPAWFNLGSLAWLPINAAAFLVLGRHLWPGGGVAGALLRASAALTWAFSPVFLGEIEAGRLTQVALVGLPLAVVGLDRASTRDLTRGELITGGVGLGLTGLGYWYYAIFLGLCAPVWLAAAARRGELRTVFTRFAQLLGVALVVVSPGLAGIAYASLSSGVSPELPTGPGGRSPIFDNALQLSGVQPAQLRGFWVWALTPGLLLALFTPGARRWLVLGALTTTYALGPGQLAFGKLWLLPYWPLWKIVPTLDRLTHPSRWWDFGVLFVVVAGFAGAAARPWSARLAVLVPLGLAAQLAARGPISSSRFSVPPLWTEVAQGEGALIVLPLMHAPDTCRWQAFHRRPVIGGMVEALPFFWPESFHSFFDSNALLLQLLAYGDGKVDSVEVRQADVDALRDVGFSQVVLDVGAWRRWSRRPADEAVSALSLALGSPQFQDPGGALWALPTAAPPGNAEKPAGVWLRPRD